MVPLLFLIHFTYFLKIKFMGVTLFTNVFNPLPSGSVPTFSLVCPGLLLLPSTGLSSLARPCLPSPPPSILFLPRPLRIHPPNSTLNLSICVTELERQAQRPLPPRLPLPPPRAPPHGAPVVLSHFALPICGQDWRKRTPDPCLGGAGH